MMNMFGPSLTRINSSGNVVEQKLPDGRTVEKALSPYSEITFEENMDSPYRHSLIGEYDLAYPGERFLGAEARGLCPLCNNTKAANANAALLTGAKDEEMAAMFGATPAQVAIHLAEHMAPIYIEVARALEILPDGVKIDDKRFEKRIARARATAKIRNRENKEDPNCGGKYIQVTHRGMLDNPSLTYAYDGNKRVAKMRPWTKRRARMELEKRAHEALNFFDELLDCRDKANDIYDLIVNPVGINENGTVVELPPDRERFSVAIQAIKTRVDIVGTMGKLGLIAMRLNEGKDNDKKRSPVLDGIMNSLLRLNDKQTATRVLESSSLEASRDDRSRKDAIQHIATESSEREEEVLKSMSDVAYEILDDESEDDESDY